MTFLTVENLSKSFGEKILLKDVTFSIEKGQKIAVVAKNGSGKSTMLKIICGLEDADSGKVIKKQGLKIGFLQQNPQFHSSHSVIDAVLDNQNDVTKAVKLYEESLLDPEDSDKMQNAFDMMDKYGAWDFDTNVREILANLKLTNIEANVESLSGGERKRLAIAKLLLEEPDLIILDEPTNHLDLEMIDWLEHFLGKDSTTLLMVTHDRYFLDRLCDTIIELDYGKMHRHNGNYTTFLEKKEEREQNEVINAIKTDLYLKKESVWVNKMPQGRGSKSTARTNNFYQDKDKNSNIKSFINEKTKKVSLEMKETRLGNKILEFNNVVKKFDDKIILDKFSYIFRNKEKLGIIGANGTGKSTFLNMIMKLEKPDSGHITYGETINFGYYSQKGINVDENQSILDTVKDVAEYTILADGSKATASQLLEKFLFHPRIQHKKVDTLSGGEKRRLYLLTVILKNPNFLILDEPTNDLDLVTIGILEEFLVNYRGCLIIVSHDRYFMDLIVDHLFVFEGNGVIKDFPGNYTDYREKRYEQTEFAEIKELEVKKKEISLSKEEHNELQKLEKEIKSLEDRKAKVSLKYVEVDPENYERIKQISDEVSDIIKLIDEKTLRWVELSEKQAL